MSESQNLGLNPNVSVDCVVFGFDKAGLKVLLIERDNPDNTEGKNYQLPGDLIRNDEDLDEAANRVLKELTNIDNLFLQQFAAFGNPLRVKRENDLEWLRSIRKDPDARVVTIGYYALIKPEDFAPSASSFARKAEWVRYEDVPELAFDHNLILESGLASLKQKMRSEPVGFELLPAKFTLRQLQNLYETVMGVEIDKRNFRRKVQGMKFLVALDEKQKGVAHKPAQLYRFSNNNYKDSFSATFDFA
ncbi:MAG: NUDIX hydrolase [Flavobacteriales bacterium]|nr:NUDIX hydrolase [Flavobacteriales bacterium]MCB9191909.1 NUDIX hydrolase [Flavobacteriales bacterium]